MWRGLLCQVWTGKVRWSGCNRFGLDVSGVDCMSQVWTGKVRCGVDAIGNKFGLDVSGLDWMCQVWTLCLRCELDM